MARAPAALTRMREICLSLPNTVETETWGKPHFRLGDKIFAGCDDGKGRASIGFKLEMAHAAELVARDDRFTRAKYVGHKGWVSVAAACWVGHVVRALDWHHILTGTGDDARAVHQPKVASWLRRWRDRRHLRSAAGT